VTLRAAFGREEITAYEPGTCTFGWGNIWKTIEGVARPLHARALVVEEQPAGRRLAYVCCDLGIVSESVREVVVARLEKLDLGLGDADVMITATHTHSGPSGFSRYLFYACCAPGFSSKVHDAIVGGIVTAIATACRALEPATLHVHAEPVPLGAPIAWNRSVEAYSRNRDVSPLPFERRDEAVDRTMTVLRVDALDGRALGLVSWFAVHGTSMHAENRLLHGDNKGEAARYLETRARTEGNPGYVAIFAQAAAGDVSPNYRFDPKRGVAVGRYDDDHESAVFSGELQARHALSVADAALRRGTRIQGGLEARIARTDFFGAPVDPEFVYGREGHRTGPPRVGLHFACGTIEGPGPIGFAGSWSRRLTTAKSRYLHHIGPPRDALRHGAMPTLMELGHGKRNRFAGLIELPARLLAAFPNAHLRGVGVAIRETDAEYQPWVPRMLPAQVMRFGPLVVAGVPKEPTTVAGRRLARVVQKAFGPEVERVVVNGYANAYASYLTTPEEYALQAYEGASTLFGQWSLPAWCTAFAALVRAMKADTRRTRAAAAVEAHPGPVGVTSVVEPWSSGPP
jgi:neutral ceramidase